MIEFFHGAGKIDAETNDPTVSPACDPCVTMKMKDADANFTTYEIERINNEETWQMTGQPLYNFCFVL